MKTQYQGMLQRRADLRVEGNVLMEKAERTTEESTRLKEIGAQLEMLNGDIEQEERVREQLRQAPATVSYTMPAQVREEPEKFKSFGEQLAAVARATSPGGTMDRRLMAAAGLNESVGSEGGFLVQTDFATDLFSQAFNQSEILRRCRSVPISTGANGTKITMIDETSRVAGSRWGGARGYWAAEAATVTASNPKFRQINLELNKLMALAYATEENLADAPQLEAVVGSAFREEMIFMAEDAVLEGDGAGKPLGILNAGCTVSVTKEVGQAAKTIVAANIDNMWSRLHPAFKGSAVWFVNPDVWPQLAALSRAVGTGGVAAFMPAMGLSGSPYTTLYGKPIVEVEYCPTLGTVGDLVLADLNQYYLAQKGGIAAASSIHVRFLYDEMTYRFTYRLDGQPRFASALTPFKGSNTLSPFVTLATRA
jgi:HK97 family phage major capsid protein